jgi:hypothetical protein
MEVATIEAVCSTCSTCSTEAAIIEAATNRIRIRMCILNGNPKIIIVYIVIVCGTACLW